VNSSIPPPGAAVAPAPVQPGSARTLSASRSLWVVVGVLIAAAGVGVLFLGSGGGQDRAAQERAIAGDWVATGRVLSASNWADEQAGDVLVRAWRIRRICTQAGCGLYLTRQTAYAPLTARLSWTGSGWRASMTQTVPCVAPGAPTVVGVEYSQWSFQYGQSRITATERAHPGPACQPASSVTGWSARRANLTSA
jgi:hypothetical protein